MSECAAMKLFHKRQEVLHCCVWNRIPVLPYSTMQSDDPAYYSDLKIKASQIFSEFPWDEKNPC